MRTCTAFLLLPCTSLRLSSSSFTTPPLPSALSLSSLPLPTRRSFSVSVHCSLAPTTLERDERFMHAALAQARAAYAQAEVPVGAVLVSEHGTVLSTGYNQVESLRDVTQHAELVALRKFTTAHTHDSWRLPPGTTLYCTLEPCPMCMSALQLARLDHLVYAAPDLRLGACGTWIDLRDSVHPYHDLKSVRTGVLQEQSASLLKQFFRERRF